MRESLLADGSPDGTPASGPPSLPRPVTPRPHSSRPRPTGPSRHTGDSAAVTFAVVLLPFAVMLLLGLWGLRRGSMWRDEAATFEVARRTVPQIWHTLASVDAVHGLYYLAMHPVLAARADEVSLRLPSVVGAATAAGTLALLGLRLAGPRVGLCAGLLFAVAPISSHYAQEGRSYALVGAGVAASTLVLTAAAERGGARLWTAYTAVTAVTCWLHELAVLTVLAHAVTLLAARVGRRVGACFLASAALLAVCLVPLERVSRGQSGQLAWLHRPGPAQAEALFSAFTGPARAISAVTVLLVVVALLAPPPRRGRIGVVAVAAPLAVVPPLVLYAVSQRHPLFLDRYLLPSVLGVALLTAAGADRVLSLAYGARPRGVARAGALTTALAGIAVAFLWQLPAQQHERRATGRPDDLAAVAALVAHRARGGDAVMFVPAYERRVRQAYPRPFRGLADLTLETSGARSGTLYGREAPVARVRARMARVRRVWVVSERGVTRSRWFARSRGELPRRRLLERRFAEHGRWTSRSGEVALWERR